MKNKIAKITLIVIGIGAIGYGAFRITEYFTGVVRLKYAKVKVEKYNMTEVDQTPIE